MYLLAGKRKIWESSGERRITVVLANCLQSAPAFASPGRKIFFATVIWMESMYPFFSFSPTEGRLIPRPYAIAMNIAHDAFNLCFYALLAGKLPPGPAGKRNFWSVSAGGAEEIKVSQQVETLLQKG